jgi:hypothetical protein
MKLKLLIIKAEGYRVGPDRRPVQLSCTIAVGRHWFNAVMEAGKNDPYRLSWQGLLSSELRQFQLMLGIYYKIHMYCTYSKDRNHTTQAKNTFLGLLVKSYLYSISKVCKP